MMGTFIEVISPNRKAPGIVFTEIERLENILSKYKPDSDISHLNRIGKLTGSAETFYIIQKAKDFWQASDGAFDITVEPLLELWGFTEKKYRVPTAEEIQAALPLVGSDKIILNPQDYMIKLAIPGMRLDLGGIAKGYALDCAVKKLKASGITSCLINSGGQVYALGYKQSRPWVVGIQNPRSQEIVRKLNLVNQSISTSGDYEQYFMRDNHRYAHIINPKTGKPADSRLVSVTVVATDGLTADALSTSIFILGKTKGETLAKRFSGTQVICIEENDVSDTR